MKKPKHDDFSFSRRAFSVVSIGGALVFLSLTVWELIGRFDGFQWWIIPAVLCGLITADFLSGIVHWTADTWGSEEMPIIGRRLLHPFRVHHVNPDDFLNRKFLDTNGDVASLVLLLLAVLFILMKNTGVPDVISTYLVSFCALGMMTNQIHQWAHFENPPKVVKFLQSMGVLLSYEDHAKHHEPPHNQNYCISTGWCNPSLCYLDFFNRFERLITQLTGCQPRVDDSKFSQLDNVTPENKDNQSHGKESFRKI